MQQVQKNTRYYSLDFWRGVACLLVIIDHSPWYVIENPANHFPDSYSKWIYQLMAHFWIGVPIFFVISGYCIAAACDAARSRPHSMTQYFCRRFRRIFPPFWMALLVLSAALATASAAGFARLFCDDIHPFRPLNSLSVWQWIGNVTLTEGWRENLGGGKSSLLLGPSWSLCFEEQFYAICGLLLLLSRRWFFRGAALLTAAVAVVAALRWTIKSLPIDGFFFDGRWLLFAAGMLVYYRIHYATARVATFAVAGLLAAAALALYCKFAPNSSIPATTITNGAEGYCVGFLFALLISVLYRWDLAIASSVILRPVTWCGVMCYSLYLIHWPVVKVTSHLLYDTGVRGAWPTLMLSVPVSLMAAVIAGRVFHVCVERRFLNTPAILPWQIRRPPGVAHPRAHGADCSSTTPITNPNSGK